MAVNKPWIKYSVIALSVLLLLLVLVELSLTAYGTFTSAVYIYVLINALTETPSIAVFITPTVWLGFAAAMSRHRGVYITLTVMCCLSLLTVIGFIAYEAGVFSFYGFYTSQYGGETQGILIAKLVIWALMIVILLPLLAICIYADCARDMKKNRYPNMPPAAYRGYTPPPQYPAVAAFESSRDYPRLSAAPPMRYMDLSMPSGRYGQRY